MKASASIEAVIGRLPKTSDGFLCTPGMSVWIVNTAYETIEKVVIDGVFRCRIMLLLDASTLREMADPRDLFGRAKNAKAKLTEMLAEEAEKLRAEAVRLEGIS